MILLPILALILNPAGEPPPAELPTDVGPAASRLFEEYVFCVRGGLFARRTDSRVAAAVAEEVRAACSAAEGGAREALVAAYRADPTLLQPGEEPESKAANLLRTWDSRIEWVVDHARNLGARR